jgi:hypothetical protein
MKILYVIWQCTWGIIQNTFGFFLFLKYRREEHLNFFGSVATIHKDKWGGVSLGMFIFINGTRGEEWKNDTLVHEFGHTIQSLILGPLYMFVIGIPSIIWCNSKKYIKLRKEKGVSYFDFYPEKWANHLGSKITKLPAPKR